ncbi:MAG: DEAD/DEAH box helicase [Thermoplasmatota archaeon]
MSKQEASPAVDLKATFRDLPLSKTTLEALDEMGFEHPSPIQEKAIPVAVKGRDVIGQARTGTGKTAAFGLPILERYDPDARHVQAMILAPTRELASQIVDELDRMGANRDLEVLPIYGGTAYEPQEKALARGVHIVVGTPGRIMDLMERGNLDVSGTTMMVLDEADRMLDMGFIDDVEWILKHMPSKHQRHTMLFSATMPEEIKGLSRRFMSKPKYVAVSSDDELTVPEIDQVYYNVGRLNKMWALTRVLDNDKGVDLMLVFCATKMMCDRLVGDLKRFKYSAEALHGDLSQARREQVLAKFDKGEVKILVATDVAARGLDIDHITHVINYDLPEKEPEVYVHRIGRTGRAGRKGQAINFVTLNDKPILKRIEMLIGRPIEEAEPPRPPRGKQDRVKRRIDWDELADKYGNITVRVEAGSDADLTPFRLHRLVQQATGLPDHAIQGLDVGKEESRFRVPKDCALRARNGVRRADLRGRRLYADFVDQETTVRTA